MTVVLLNFTSYFEPVQALSRAKISAKSFQTNFLWRKDEYLILAISVLYARAEHTIWMNEGSLAGQQHSFQQKGLFQKSPLGKINVISVPFLKLFVCLFAARNSFQKLIGASKSVKVSWSKLELSEL